MIRLQAWSQSRAHCVEEQDEEERLSDVKAVGGIAEVFAVKIKSDNRKASLLTKLSKKFTYYAKVDKILEVKIIFDVSDVCTCSSILSHSLSLSRNPSAAP